MPQRMADTINIGIAEIYFYREGSNMPIYLGLTKEGVTFKYEPNYHELVCDQTGTTPLDDVFIGEKASAEVKVLDSSKKKIAFLMPASAVEGTNENPSAVTFGGRPGPRASQYFGKLRIHPVSIVDSSYDIIIYRTTNTGGMELAFKLEEEWVIPCMFKAYYDDFRKPGDQLFRIGEEGSSSGETHQRVVLFWITPSNPTVKSNGTIEFHANAMFEDGSTKDVTPDCDWISSSPDKVSLSTLGSSQTATAVASGSSVIRAEYIGYSNSTSMVVS